jgi:hypothetical protein
MQSPYLFWSREPLVHIFKEKLLTKVYVAMEIHWNFIYEGVDLTLLNTVEKDC